MPSLSRIVFESGLRVRLVFTQSLSRLGFSEYAFLLPMAVMIGIVSAAAAVAFHQLIHKIRDLLYERAFSPGFLYGPGVAVLVLLPALGGLAVGLFSTFVMREREGHGIIDVMEMVLRSRGQIRPMTAIEKILTAAATIGTGGSAGAEGPIVQIGAAISSGIGSVFQVNPSQLPILIGCGTAAGISAIFSSPMGGVLFTLEVILLDFSVRAFTPIVSASVVAYVTTQAIFHTIDPTGSHYAIFSVTLEKVGSAPTLLDWRSVPNMVLLGLVCGVAGVAMTRLMYWSETLFHRLPVHRAIRPALGGAMVGAMGVGYVILFGWMLLGRHKPFAFENYPMPAFFGDGYGVVQQLIGKQPYLDIRPGPLVLLLVFLGVAKVLATCLTLSSGGSGGVIAPSLFLGATVGGLLGMALSVVHQGADIEPGFYALIGMGAVLSAVVHAPLASILILSEVTGGQRNVMLPAMLACVIATGSARLLFKDSVYTLSLRRRGLRPGGGDLNLLHRMTVEQVDLEPVLSFAADTPLQALISTSDDRAISDVVVVDLAGEYIGMVTADDVNTAMVQREAIPLLLVGEMLRPELPCVASTDDLASVLEAFSRFDVSRLPVCLAANPKRVIGLVSRSMLMRTYTRALAG
jgi:CIC family chloride channel protein